MPEATTTAEQIINGAEQHAIGIHSPGKILHQEASSPAQGQTQEAAQFKRPNGPKKYEFIEGGSSTERIALNTELTRKIVDRLQNRMRVAEALKGKGTELSTIDRFILSSGPDAIKNFKSGESKGQDLTTKDLALAWSSINDELLQKSLASGRTVGLREVETQRQERRWLVRKVPVTETRIDTGVKATDLVMTTPYTTELGVGTWLEDKIVSDLEDLHNLRLNLARSLGVTGSLETFLSDPTLVDLSGPTSPIWQRKVGFLLHDAVVGELTNNEKILKLYESNGVHNFLELQAKDPVVSAQALYEANQAALTTFAREIAQSYLKGEKPNVDTAVIKSQADKLRQEPKPEEITPLINEKIKTTQAKLDAVNKDLGKVEEEITALTTREEYGRGELEKEASKRLDFLEGRKDEILKKQLLTKADLESFQLKLDEALESHNAPEARIQRQEKATALDKWEQLTSSTNYKEVIDARFAQTFEDPFTLERLSSIREVDGKIEGAEKIRQHTFWLIDKTGYNVELSRKMLSDETIAKAIIWTYKLDAGQITDLKTALPYLKSSQFKAGDLLRFVIHEGLKSAERGNPYLTLDEYYATPKPELQLEAESIYKEGVGKAEEKTNAQGEKGLAWGASISKPVKLSGFERNDLPLYLSLGLIFDKSKGGLLYKTYIKMDERFIQSLPRALDASLPSEIKEKLYDATTGLLHSENIKLNAFIQIQDDVFNGEDRIVKLLDYLKNNVSEDAPKMLKISLANYFLESSPAERLESLKGLGGTGIPLKEEGVTTTVKNSDGSWNTVAKDYQLDFDNAGNFFLVDLTTNERHELQSFYKRELENFRESKGVQALSKAEREILNAQSFAKIQERLGEAILYAQSV